MPQDAAATKTYRPPLANALPLLLVPLMALALGLFVWFTKGIADVALAAAAIVAILGFWYFRHKITLSPAEDLLEYRTLCGSRRIRLCAISAIGGRQPAGLPTTKKSTLRNALWIEFKTQDGRRQSIGINAKVFANRSIASLKSDIEAVIRSQGGPESDGESHAAPNNAQH